MGDAAADGGNQVIIFAASECLSHTRNKVADAEAHDAPVNGSDSSCSSSLD
jgi:hypothetical protein